MIKLHVFVDFDSIEGPQGGTPPPPNFEMGVWACGAEILCAVMCVWVGVMYVQFGLIFFSVRTYQKHIKPMYSYASFIVSF